MRFPLPIFLLFLWTSFAACNDSKDPSDGFSDTDVPDGDGPDDSISDPEFDGPGCPEVDEDGDTIPDYVEGEGDSDGDTIPDCRDEDSDNDTILDRHEAGDFDCGTPPFDTDEDGTPDYLDSDSDGDTLPDSEEAGDDNLNSYPRDSDGWGTPDFRDIDSDNDGLSDSQEVGLGLNPYDEDSDGDTFPDFEEIASDGGDPLDPEKGVGENEDIFALWYKGRSQYQIYTAAARYGKNDIFFLVDDTHSASGAADVFKEQLADTFLPRLKLELDGVRAGLGIFSGWGIEGEFIHYTCYHPFYGLAQLTDRAETMEQAVQRISLCPEPGDGGSAVAAVWNAAGDGSPDHWSPNMRECAEDDLSGGGCFRPNARRFIFLLVEGDFPDETPEGYPEYHSLDEIKELLAAEGIHLISILVQDELFSAPYEKAAALARESGAIDRTLRPLVYPAGSDGADLTLAMENATSDIKKNPPADVTIEKVDGADWPWEMDLDGDGEPENYDATGFVSTIYPRGWSPPPGVSPTEAVSHVDDITYVRTIPNTEVSYKIYFRNYSLQQGLIGFMFAINLVLKNELGYTYKVWPVKLIVPCLPGDEAVEEE